MDNSVTLIPGRAYKVVKPFTDYDGIVHPTGETWTYEGTHFLPYEDGLTLHVQRNGAAMVYRLQWRREEQAHIIEHFNNYVELCEL